MGLTSLRRRSTDDQECNTNSTRDRYRRRWAILPLLIFGVVWLQITMTTAHAFQVCTSINFNCAPLDAGCLTAQTAAIAACETKMHAYNLYMEQMGAGVPRLQLPAVYQDVLRSRYPQADF